MVVVAAVGLLLDTNALSAIADADAKALQESSRAQVIAIPAIVLGEYLFGVRQSRYRSEYEKWLAELPPNCRVLDVTADTASWYAEVRSQLKKAGTPIPSNDLWIAALCRQHSYSLMSRDRHFDAVKGLQRIDW
jgi:predicted nucleic acid-binding protein